MKLDSEPVVCHSTLKSFDGSKVTKIDGSVFDTTETKAIMKENDNGNSYHANGHERFSGLERFALNNGDQRGVIPQDDCSVVIDDFTYGKETAARDAITQCSISSELFKDTNLYADKNVMDCEPPELMVCYKENIAHVIKNVCVDEGVHSTDKILIESRKDDSDYLPSGLLKDRLDSDTFILDKFKMSPVTNIDKGATDSVAAKNCHLESGAALCNGSVKPVKDASAEEFIAGSKLAVQEFGMEKSLKALRISPLFGDEELTRQSDQLPLLCSESHATASLAEELSKPQADTSHSNCEFETGKIASAFDCSSPATNSRGKSREHVCEEPRKSQSVPDKDGGISDGLLAAKLIQRGEGESSFSMAPRITYSGPIPHSGNISIRSESSTTSTRSFAFPILQSECNTSPVRMAKANRKHRGWRLLCCLNASS